MKSALVILLLLLASSLQAQTRDPELLDFCDTTYGRVSNWVGGNDGENMSGVKMTSHYPALAYMLWYLPETKPDSLRFVIRNTAPFSLYTLIASQKWYCRIDCYDDLSPDSFRTITIPYDDCRETDIMYAGIGVVDCRLHSSEDTTSHVEVDAVYAVWAEPEPLSVMLTDRLVRVQQVNWFDVPQGILGNKPVFFGTLPELQRSGLKGMFFSINGKYYIAD